VTAIPCCHILKELSSIVVYWLAFYFLFGKSKVLTLDWSYVTLIQVLLSVF
jgi:hypothetical protein